MDIDEGLLLLRAGPIIDEDMDADDQPLDLIQRTFRVRLKDIETFLVFEDQKLNEIHNVTGATIKIFTSSVLAKRHNTGWIELRGTDWQIENARLSILVVMREEYGNLNPPTLLWPVEGDDDEYGHTTSFIPLHQTMRVLGKDDWKVLALERETNTWIKVVPIRGNQPNEMVGYVREVIIHGTLAGRNNVLNEFENGPLDVDDGGDVIDEDSDMEDV